MRERKNKFIIPQDIDINCDGLVEYIQLEDCVIYGYNNPIINDVYLEVSDYSKLLLIASMYNNLDIVKFIMTLPPHIHISTNTIFNIVCGAATEGSVVVFKYILETHSDRFDIKYKDDYVLCCATENGYLSIVQLICEFQKNMNLLPINSYKVLLYPVIHGYLDIVKYLCELPSKYGIRVNIDNNKIIDFAYKHKQYSIVNYLLTLDIVYNTLTERQYNKYKLVRYNETK